MKILTKMLFVMIITALAVAAHAGVDIESRTSFNYIIPQGDFAEKYNQGYGVYANYDFNFNNNFAARIDFGWNDISGEETHFVDSLGQVHIHHPNMSIWEFTGGFKTGVSILYIEGRGGYFTGLNEWGFVPAAGLRFGSFDIQGSYTIAGDNEWASGRLGFAW